MGNNAIRKPLDMGLDGRFTTLRRIGEPAAYLADALRHSDALFARRPGSEGQRFRSYEGLVLALGTPFFGSRLRFGITAGLPRRCYANTIELVLQNPGRLTYHEGYGLHADINLPILHAWAVDGDGTVYDRTWDDPERAAYFGMPFEIDDVERMSREAGGRLGVLSSDYLGNFSLLRTGRLPWHMEADSS